MLRRFPEPPFARKPPTQRYPRYVCATSLIQAFEKRYRRSPRLFHAPGRVNLIGEHTDYNDGFVLPAAIELGTWVAAAPREDRTVAVYSENLGAGVAFPLDQDEDPQHDWTDYIRGVAMVLERAGHRLHGAELLIQGDLPLGAGLSSSASLEVAAMLALLATSGIEMDRTQIAKLCQRAENTFAGVQSGIMDQFIACQAMAGHALLLDCRSLAVQHAPIPEEVTLVIANSMVQHEHAAGEYNRRRADCEAGVHHLARRIAHVRALRDVTLGQLEEHGQELPGTIFRRCRHVITENARVVQAFEALIQGDLGRFGELMYASHASLRDDYEVSCRELNWLVEIAAQQPGVYGSRMTGGGFGGCTITLVASGHAAEFAQELKRRYQAASHLEPWVYTTRAAGAAAEA